MAHNLAVNAEGKERMAFRGSREAIWHGLGEEIPDGSSFDQVMEIAHLDFNVRLDPIGLNRVDFINPEFADWKLIETHKATINVESGEVLGVVGSRYRVCQNRDAFSWLGSFPNLRVDTAGALGKGEKVWILAEDLDGSFRIRGEEIKAYLLFFNSHDGSLPIGGGFTPTRVVCQNTLNLALKKGLMNGFSIRHTGSHVEQLKEAERILGIERKFTLELQEVGEKLAETSCSLTQAKELTGVLIPDNEDAKKNTRTKNQRDSILELFHFGAGNRGESRWDWLNAVVEYSDHDRSFKGEGRQRAENRMRSVLWGSALDLKQRAFELVRS